MNTPAGIAFVGAGYISYLHMSAIRDNPNTRPVALASRSRPVADHRARIFGVAAYTFDDLDSMLGRDDLDIAIVESPNSLHAEHSLAAIRARKHVIIEKPMVLRLADAAAVTSAAASAGVGLGYAENQVFAPVAVRARELIAEGLIGGVRRVEGVFMHGGPSRGSWFWEARTAGGGAHLDLGSHALEVALYLAGKPEITQVTSCRMRRDGDRGLDVFAEALAVASNGIEIRTLSSWTEPQETCTYEVSGERGSITVRFAPRPQSLTLHPAGQEPQDLDFPGKRQRRYDLYVASYGYSGQLAHFETCFRDGEEPRESAQRGSNVLRVLAAGYLAAARSRAVDVARDVPDDRSPIELLDG